MFNDLRKLNLRHKKVLVRCDFNVPLDLGAITDTSRIDASLSTIRFVLEQGGAAILCSHLGRPTERTEKLSLKPVAEYLSGCLGAKVALAPDCIGEITGRLINSLAAGHALMLENVRFHREEEANDRDFAHELARGKDTYVNDAFGSAHRAHASTVGVTRFISERAPGFLMLRELEVLGGLLQSPARPFIAILGGAKVSDKIGVIRNLMTRVDCFLVGGAMAYTFLAARGLPVGKSLVDVEKLEVAQGLLADAERRGVRFLLPIDHLVAASPEAEPTVAGTIPPEMMGLDIGPQTIERFRAELVQAKTVVWNGPLGYFEKPAFAHGTLAVGEAVANSGAVSVLGGGDTAAAVASAPWVSKFTHISTGGGATLEFLEGRELPGVKALEL